VGKLVRADALHELPRHGHRAQAGLTFVFNA
jgi:hypothetical protein